jgi:hypothetical protein
MVDLVKTGIGFFILFLSIIIRVFVFSIEFLQNIVGMDINEAYALIDKVKALDPIVFVVIIGLSILLIVWGLEG